MHGLALKGNSDQPRASEATPWVKYYKLMHGLALKGQQHIALSLHMEAAKRS